MLPAALTHTLKQYGWQQLFLIPWLLLYTHELELDRVSYMQTVKPEIEAKRYFYLPKQSDNKVQTQLQPAVAPK